MQQHLTMYLKAGQAVQGSAEAVCFGIIQFKRWLDPAPQKVQAQIKKNEIRCF